MPCHPNRAQDQEDTLGCDYAYRRKCEKDPNRRYGQQSDKHGGESWTSRSGGRAGLRAEELGQAEEGVQQNVTAIGEDLES